MAALAAKRAKAAQQAEQLQEEQQSEDALSCVSGTDLDDDFFEDEYGQLVVNNVSEGSSSSSAGALAARASPRPPSPVSHRRRRKRRKRVSVKALVAGLPSPKFFPHTDCVSDTDMSEADLANATDNASSGAEDSAPDCPFEEQVVVVSSDDDSDGDFR